MTLYLGNNLISGTQTLVGESRNIGQIIPSAIPLTDAGLHLLDGTLILGGGIYSAFVTYISGLVSTYPDLFVTEADWQTSINTYGVCGKFVYDSVANTVRLPKITGILEGTTDVTALGDLVEAGLPNITGGSDDSDTYWYGRRPSASGLSVQLGAIKYTTGTGSNGVYTGSGGQQTAFSFDASESNSLYGNSSTVQPQTIKAFYYIVIATSTKTDIQVDIDEIATDLNGKADVDLTNCTKPHIVETYVNGTSWYRVYSDGWCEQGGETSNSTTADGRSIAYLKTFANTNYCIQIIMCTSSTDGSLNNTDPIYITSRTASGCTAQNYDGSPTRTYLWKAEGYLA